MLSRQSLMRARSCAPRHPRALVVVALLVTVAACRPAEHDAEDVGHRVALPPFEEVASYGWSEPADSATDGVIGRAIAVAESEDSAVYVLDMLALRVVVFEPDGRVRRVIGSGPGSGPGEFRRPISLTLDARGDVLVLDGDDGRITRFDSTGAVRSTITPRVPLLQILAIEDRLLGVRRYAAGGRAVVVLDSSGAVIDSLVPITEGDAEVLRAGEIGMLGRAGDAALFAFPTPGPWVRVDEPNAPREGAGLFPGQQIIDTMLTGSPVSILPAATRGIGRLADGRLVLYYFVRGDGENGGNFLALFDSTGRYEGSAPVVGASGLAFAVSRSGSEVLVWRDEPVPQIVRLRVPIVH